MSERGMSLFEKELNHRSLEPKSSDEKEFEDFQKRLMAELRKNGVTNVKKKDINWTAIIMTGLIGVGVVASVALLCRSNVWFEFRSMPDQERGIW